MTERKGNLPIRTNLPPFVGHRPYGQTIQSGLDSLKGQDLDEVVKDLDKAGALPTTIHTFNTDKAEQSTEHGNDDISFPFSSPTIEEVTYVTPSSEEKLSLSSPLSRQRIQGGGFKDTIINPEHSNIERTYSPKSYIINEKLPGTTRIYKTETYSTDNAVYSLPRIQSENILDGQIKVEYKYDGIARPGSDGENSYDYYPCAKVVTLPDQSQIEFTWTMQESNGAIEYSSNPKFDSLEKTSFELGQHIVELNDKGELIIRSNKGIPYKDVCSQQKTTYYPMISSTDIWGNHYQHSKEINEINLQMWGPGPHDSIQDAVQQVDLNVGCFGTLSKESEFYVNPNGDYHREDPNAFYDGHISGF